MALSKEKADLFFTTDMALPGAVVISEFANAWPIEDTFRNVRQSLGAERPQCWRSEGPQRAAAFAYLLYAVIWMWYIKHGYHSSSLSPTP